MNLSFTSAKLELQKGIWRVNCVGKIVLSEKTTRIYVSFTKIKPQGISYPFKKSSEENQSVSLLFHISHICFFRIGSLWKDGKLWSFAPRNNIIVFDVLPSTAEFISLVDLPSVAERYLERSEYLLSGFGNSKLLKVQVNKNNSNISSLIIPCSEILRFYFAVSQRMIKLIVEGRIDNLINWSESRIQGATPIIKMNKDTSRLESSLLAEALMNETCREALMFPHKSLVKQLNTILTASSQQIESELHLYSMLPFYENTGISVAGIPVRLSPTEQSFYVMEIVSSDHSLSFSKYIREVDFKSHSSKADSAVCGKNNIPDYGGGSVESLPIKDAIPNKKIKRLQEIQYSSQFDRYYALFRRFRLIKANDVSKTKNINEQIAVEALSFEDGGGYDQSTNVQGIGVYVQQSQLANRSLLFFIEMIKKLKLLVDKKYSITFICPTHDKSSDSNIGEFSSFPSDIAGVRSWHKISAVNEVRPRFVSVVQVLCKRTNRCFYLLEMEAKNPETEKHCTLLLECKKNIELTHSDLVELLEITALKKGWPHPTMNFNSKHDLKKRVNIFFTNFRIEKFKHPNQKDLTAEVWAKKLFDTLEGLSFLV